MPSPVDTGNHHQLLRRSIGCPQESMPQLQTRASHIHCCLLGTGMYLCLRRRPQCSSYKLFHCMFAPLLNLYLYWILQHTTQWLLICSLITRQQNLRIIMFQKGLKKYDELNFPYNLALRMFIQHKQNKSWEIRDTLLAFLVKKLSCYRALRTSELSKNLGTLLSFLYFSIIVVQESSFIWIDQK